MNRLTGVVSCINFFLIVAATIFLSGTTAWGVAGGACCFDDGDCEILSGDPSNPEGCVGKGGFYMGSFTYCEEVNCDLGACCLPDSTCSDLIELACTNEGGIWNSKNSCSELPEGYCTTGACCLEFSTGNSNSQRADAETQDEEISICRDDIIKSECISGLWNPTLTCDVEGCCNPTPGACVVDGTCKNVPKIKCLGQWSETRCPEQVPTLTEWGFVLLSIMLIGSATLVIRRRKRSS